jgi:Chlorophyll A-B binding protein
MTSSSQNDITDRNKFKMNSSKSVFVLTAIAGSSLAFAPLPSTKLMPIHMASTVNEDRPIYDPFNLYGRDSEERTSGRIRQLEPIVSVKKPVLDPLKLYSDTSQIDEDVDMSDSLPFVPRPITLTRAMAGDVGFDPFNFAENEERLLWQRQAELKHARIAMLAAVGWPLSELYDKPLAQMWHMKPILGFGDRVPSLLNGGLSKVPPLYWVAVLGLASAIEVRAMNKGSKSDWGPVGLYSNSPADVAEIKNGRLAMMAIVGFAVQEFVTKIGVVNQTPIFFHPLNEYVEYFSNHVVSM